ncbi:hypothetical protein [Nocardiopsis sp. FR4]|uniref:hypothetical protein n=1 Tax=Nocardiopsis sp. FR4 TaxID=2605985 RepID=UPI00135B381D|nr:hypothetical protein [Nocardiopsis sp. FR4]
MFPQKRTQIAASLLGISLVGIVPSNAFANESNQDPFAQLQTAKIDLGEIDINTPSHVSTFSSTDESTSKVDEYLEQQAREGNLVDIGDVRTAQLADPLTEGTIDLVWVDGLIPSEINRSELPLDDEQSQSGIGVGFAQEPATEEEFNSQTVGMGYNYAEPNGMYRVSNDCWWGYFEPAYSSEAGNHHQMMSCYEKWAESGTREWAYNRWGLWDMAAHSWGRAETVDYTIRSRPWAGTSSDITKLNRWVPLGPSQCTPSGGTFSLTFAGAGISVPIGDCTNTEVDPNLAERSMGIDWNGKSSNQLGLDFAMHVTARDSSLIPSFADYNWAEVQNCGAFCAPGNPVYAHVHKDSGW